VQMSVETLALALGTALFSAVLGFLGRLQDALIHEKLLRQVASETTNKERGQRTSAEKELRKINQNFRVFPDSSSRKEVSNHVGAKSEFIDDDSSEIGLKFVGILESCFTERWGIPRQSLLVPNCRAILQIDKSNIDANDDHLSRLISDLKLFGHCWVLFVFHENTNFGKHRSIIKSKITPPRLLERVGIFSTRTPHRPNPIGLSLAKIDRVSADGCIHLSGIDLLNGTPILDIKPCIPSDFLSESDLRVPSWIMETHRPCHIMFGDVAIKDLQRILSHDDDHQVLRFYQNDEFAIVKQTIEQILSLDIRPAHQKKKNTKKSKEQQKDERSKERILELKFDRLLIKFYYQDEDRILVESIERKTG